MKQNFSIAAPALIMILTALTGNAQGSTAVIRCTVQDDGPSYKHLQLSVIPDPDHEGYAHVPRKPLDVFTITHESSGKVRFHTDINSPLGGKAAYDAKTGVYTYKINSLITNDSTHFYEECGNGRDWTSDAADFFYNDNSGDIRETITVAIDTKNMAESRIFERVDTRVHPRLLDSIRVIRSWVNGKVASRSISCSISQAQ